MSVFEPWMGKRVGPFSPPQLPNLNRQQFTAEQSTGTSETPETSAVVKPKKPTRPGKFKAIQLSEEPQMDHNPAQPTAPTGKIPVKHTRAYPKMQKKQTAPGTKPKKR